MKSRIDFEPIIIEDLLLDQAGVQILTKIGIILSKLELYETSSPLERDTGMIIELSKIINSVEELKHRYIENVKAEKDKLDEQAKILEESTNEPRQQI